MRIQFSAVFLFSITLLAVTPLLGDESDNEAVHVAKTYVEQLKKGKVEQAVHDYWNTDTLLSSSFGLMYLELPEVERERAQSAFAEFVAAPFASERLQQLFSSIEIQSAKPTQIDASTVSVRMQFVGDDGNFRSVNTMLLTKKGDEWQIVDQRLNDMLSIRATLSLTHVSTAKGPDDTIPVVLERVAAETLKEYSTPEKAP